MGYNDIFPTEVTGGISALSCTAGVTNPPCSTTERKLFNIGSPKGRIDVILAFKAVNYFFYYLILKLKKLLYLFVFWVG